MKIHRILRSIQAAAAAAALLSLTVLGASAFPFDRYSYGKDNLYTSITESRSVFNNRDGTEGKLALVKSGIISETSVTCTGTSGNGKRGKKLYEQRADIRISFPQGYFDLLKESYRTDDKKILECSEKDDFFEAYDKDVASKSGYEIRHSLPTYDFVMIYGDSPVQDAMDGLAEKYRNKGENWSGIYGELMDHSTTIDRCADGYRIVHTEKFGKSEGLHSEDWVDERDFADTDLECRYYVRIMTLPEIPNVYILLAYEQFTYVYASVDDASHTEYLSLYNKGKSRVSEIRNSDMGQRILDLPSLVTVRWDEPTVNVGDTDENVNVVVTEKAEDTPGEASGTVIPAVIVIGAAAAAAALGAAAAVSGADRKDRAGSSYAMRIYKEFGDTLFAGERVPVYARIVEISKGRELDRPDLTRKILIETRDAALSVTMNGALSGKYCSAWVEVRQGTDAETGNVDFVFTGEGGTFTDVVTFKIEAPKIHFYQPNIALEAKDENGAEVCFTVDGLDPENTKVDLEIAGGSSYAAACVQAVAGETGEKIPGTYFAVLGDINEEEGDPGTYSVHTLRVRATDGKTEASGSIDIYRVSVGLNVGAAALNCYRTLKKTAAGKNYDDLTAADFDISYTRVPVMILKVDEEKHQMYYSPAIPEITVTCADKGDSLMQERLDGIGIESVLTEIKEGVSYYTFYCRKGWLEPPVRVTAHLHARAVEEEDGVEVEYLFDRDITLLSQRVREKVTDADRENDRKITEWLTNTMCMITDYGLCDMLPSEYMLIQTMWEGYDEQFGYDPILISGLQNNISLCLHRLKRQALKDRQDILVKQQESANYDNNYLTILSKSFAMVSDRYVDTWGGLAARIGLGICTGGLSEVPFLAMDVNKAVSEYNERTVLCDRTAEGVLFAGAKPLIISALIGGTIKGVFKGVALTYRVTVPKAAQAGLKRYAMNAARAAMKKIPEKWVYASKNLAEKFRAFADKVNSYDPRRRMFNIRKAAAEADAMNLKARGIAQQSVLDVRKGGLSAKGELLDKVQRVGELKAAAKIERFKKAWNRMATDSGPDAVKELKAAFMAVEKDTLAINMLNAEGKTGAQIAGKMKIPNKYRAGFNECKATFMDDPAEILMKRKTAAKYNIPEEDVVIMRATGKSAKDLKQGISSAYDSDNSILIVDKRTGKTVYISQADTNEIVATSYCEAVGVSYSSIDDAITKCTDMKVVGVTPAHAEFYREFERLKTLQAFSDDAIAHNMKTGEYKMAFEFKAADSKWDEFMKDPLRAKRISEECDRFLKREIADVSDDTLKAVGYTEKMNECMHQVPKTHDLYVAKDINGQAMGTPSGFRESSSIFTETCRYAENQGTYNITVGEMNEILARRGTSYAQSCSDMVLDFKVINTNCRAANEKAASALWNTSPGSGTAGAAAGTAGAAGAAAGSDSRTAF